MVRTLADEVRELQDRLVKIAEGGESNNWPNFQIDDKRYDALNSVKGLISQALHTHNYGHDKSQDFGEEYFRHIDEAMEILYAILDQHNRL